MADEFDQYIENTGQDEFAEYLETPSKTPQASAQPSFMDKVKEWAGQSTPIGGGDMPMGLDPNSFTQGIQQQTNGPITTMQNIGQVVPALEMAGNLISGLPGNIMAGLHGLRYLPQGLDLASQKVQEAQQLLVPQPFTPGGKQLTEAVNYPLEQWQQKVVEPTMQGYEDMNAPWWLKAGAKTALEGGPQALALLLGVRGKSPVVREAQIASIDKQISSTVRKGIEKAVRPSVQNVRDYVQLDKKLQNYESAIPDMIETKPTLNPETAMLEASKANHDTKIRLWKEEHDMTIASSQKGSKVNYKPFYDEIDNIAKSDQLMKFNPYEVERLRAFKERIKTNGELVDPLVAEADLASLNAESQGFWKATDPKYNGAGANSERLAQVLRKQLYSAVDELGNKGFADLRKRLGSQMAIEKEMSNRALVDLRKPPSSFFDIINAPVFGTFVEGIFTGSISKMLKAGAMQVAKSKLKADNNANFIMVKMWDKTRDLMEKKKALKGEEVTIPTMKQGFGENTKEMWDWEFQRSAEGAMTNAANLVSEMRQRQSLAQSAEAVIKAKNEQYRKDFLRPIEKSRPKIPNLFDTKPKGFETPNMSGDIKNLMNPPESRLIFREPSSLKSEIPDMTSGIEQVIRKEPAIATIIKNTPRVGGTGVPQEAIVAMAKVNAYRRTKGMEPLSPADMTEVKDYYKQRARGKINEFRAKKGLSPLGE